MSKLRIVDFAGTQINLPQPAKRIACLTSAALDVLRELNLEPVGYLTKGIADKSEFYGELANNFTPLGSWIFPNIRAIRKLKPDLVIGWSFPHRFYRKLLGSKIPLYLMGGNGYDGALRRLRDISYLTDSVSQAEIVTANFRKRLEIYSNTIPASDYKTVLFMGGSKINCLSREFIAETNIGTFGSIIQQFCHYPWLEPKGYNMEPGFINVSLRKILTVNPDIIFVQTYPPGKIPLSQQLANNQIWQQLKAVQNNNVYEIEQLWHYANGTRMIGLTLDKLMPIIYPAIFGN
ncbi:iron(III) dicitrate-binding periplasmic protein [Calothrix parasitica NIES-267]|uniref:Iron(III) dicitrate-binding periplasmic protein n=1 Tax=Calothrix parasitica NIES-267 TaxID=1973488 RepID=A0A1Z4LK80_9CYAN|nr:iron(III) dicitrate-binding periplasmic protein [Calothrix parasitica NIES-267]